MDTSSANFPQEVQSLKNENTFGVDKNIAHLISGYLTNKDLVNLCCVSNGGLSKNTIMVS